MKYIIEEFQYYYYNQKETAEKGITDYVNKNNAEVVSMSMNRARDYLIVFFRVPAN